MLKELKKSIGVYILKLHIRKKKQTEINFNTFFSSSENVMVIFPAENLHYQSVHEIIEFFKNTNKIITVLLPEAIKDLTLPNGFKVMTYNENDHSKLGLPGKEFVKSLKKVKYDIIIDLNEQDNLFCTAVTNYLNSKIRVGFVKKDSDLFYNFQVPNGINSENSYRNLLNSFNMF